MWRFDEVVAFDFSSDLPRDQILATINVHWCSPLDHSLSPVGQFAGYSVNTLASDDDDRRYSLSVQTYMHTGSDVELLSDFVKLAIVISSLSFGDLYYYPQTFADEYDEGNTVAISLVEFCRQPPEGSVFYKRYRLCRENE